MPKWSTPSTPGIGEPFADVRACARSPSVALGAPSATADSEKISRATAVQRVARFAERFLIDPPLVDAAEANALNGLKQDRRRSFQASPTTRAAVPGGMLLRISTGRLGRVQSVLKTSPLSARACFLASAPSATHSAPRSLR